MVSGNNTGGREVSVEDLFKGVLQEDLDFYEVLKGGSDRDDFFEFFKSKWQERYGLDDSTAERIVNYDEIVDGFLALAVYKKDYAMIGKLSEMCAMLEIEEDSFLRNAKDDDEPIWMPGIVEMAIIGGDERVLRMLAEVGYRGTDLTVNEEKKFGEDFINGKRDMFEKYQNEYCEGIDSAATKIQKTYRGAKTRKDFEEKKDAATKIQKTYRGAKTKKDGDVRGAGAAKSDSAAKSGVLFRGSAIGGDNEDRDAVPH